MIKTNFCLFIGLKQVGLTFLSLFSAIMWRQDSTVQRQTMKRAYRTTRMVLVLSNWKTCAWICDVTTQQRLEADWALTSLISSYRPILILLLYLINLLKIAACVVFTLHVACKGIEQPFCHWQILQSQISARKDILDYSAPPSCCSLSQKQ